MHHQLTPRTTITRRWLAVAAAFALGASACGGDDSSGTTDATEPTEALDATDGAGENAEPAGADASDSSAVTNAETTDAGTTAATEPGSAGTWDPGEIQMRVVNLLAQPIDVYVRTTGFIEAWPAFPGVEPGAVTELVAPPTDGSMVVTVAGAGDPECVIDCPHFLAEISATPAEGPVRTVIVHELDGLPASFDLWESPTAERTGNANSMPPADPAQGLAVVNAVAVTGADFGLRLGLVGVAGCAEPVNLTNVLVGGNQTPAFAYVTGTAEVSLYANDDRECAGPAVGGPFTIAGGPGTRTHVILTGEPGAMDAIVLPMVGDEDAAAAALDAAAETGTAGDTGAAVDPGARDLAIELMAVEVEAGLGIPAEQSSCVAALLVDAIGVDVLLVDGALVELDTLPVEYDEPATEALVASVDECGVDPAVLGA